MSVVLLETGFNIQVAFRPAPFHKRMFAFLIDMAIVLAYFYVFYQIFFRTIGLLDSSGSWYFLLLTLPIFLYHLLFELYMHGQSPGKYWMKIKVITEEGGAPTTSQYLIRWMFRLIDVTLWLVPGLLSVMLTPRSQRLGDLAAGTLVIDTRRDTSWQDTVFEVVEESYRPRYPDVMKLSDKDINTLKSIIRTGNGKSTQLIHSIAQRIQAKFDISTEEDPIDFLRTMMKDYNYYTSEK